MSHIKAILALILTTMQKSLRSVPHVNNMGWINNNVPLKITHFLNCRKLTVQWVIKIFLNTNHSKIRRSSSRFTTSIPQNWGSVKSNTHTGWYSGNTLGNTTYKCCCSVICTLKQLLQKSHTLSELLIMHS